MGRCNNKRAQQAAQQLRNTPSRARFSKPPPSKKKGGRGGGRGGSGGRGSGSGGRGRGHATVIDKLSKRVEQKSRPDSASRTMRGKRHPLDGLDLNKLDEVTLSEESILLVTKLLTDLNVMEAPQAEALAKETKEEDFEGQSLFAKESITNDSMLTLSAPEWTPSSARSGYSEYENDEEEYMDDPSAPMKIFDSTAWEEETTAENEPSVEDDEEESEDDSALLQTPLFLHLTKQFSFTESHAKRACRAVENRWAVPEQKGDENENNNNNTDELLGLAMDWLCLHLTEQELKDGFRPNPISKKQLSNTSSLSTKGILLAGTGRTRPIPHASISVAAPITSDHEWRDAVQRQARSVGFVRLGFHQAQAEKACDETKHVSTSVNAQDDDDALLILLKLLAKEAMGNNETTSPAEPTEADLDYCREEQEQEVQALEAIYDDQFEVRRGYDKGHDRYILSISPNETLKQPARSEECKLHVLVTPGYPILAAPLLLFTNPTLPPSLLRQINIALIREAHQTIGEPAVFGLVDFLSTNLSEMQNDFIKEQRTIEMEAEQLRLRREAGHNVDQCENDGKVGRRQRARLKGAEKSHDRAAQMERENEERRALQQKRLERIEQQKKSHRHSLAERAIHQRAQERIQEETERAARAAMNAAFNRGESADEARAAAQKARKQSLRENGEVVSSDDEDDDNVDERSDGKQEETDANVLGDGSSTVSTERVLDNSGTNGTSSITRDENVSVGKQKRGATPTTMAFMERLRQFYQDAAKEKMRSKEVVDVVSSQNGQDEKSSSNGEDRNCLAFHLTQPKVADGSKSQEETSEEVHRVPAPVAVPAGDLANVMKDVIKVQRQQPWLVSNEARAPAFDSEPGELTCEQSREQKQISSTLCKELKRKYQSEEEWASKHPDFDHLKNRGKNSSNPGKSAQQFHIMMSQRRRLPAYLMKDEIVKTIASNQITVISGDTGCGKTTQVPQLVLDDLIWKNKGSGANIIVTQPRRISAIGVAERVASERCERVGETAGYSIRLENKRSAKTRLLLCTTGILLRRLQCDPDLASVSHVFVDEVHERDINTDFLLIILKDLLARRKSLKLILMSATLNAETFSAYFAGCPTVSIPGRTHPVKENRLEDILQITGYEVQEGSDYAQKTTRDKAPRFSKSMMRKMYHPKYDSTVISSLARVDESVINYELIAALLEHIALNEEEGAILVFLPGLMEITKTVEELYKKEFFTDPSRVLVYPLHSSLSTAEQTAVFDVPPEGVRKIVVSTNIAETSITIEDVVFVVDAGRVKENRQDEVNQMPTLVECWVSRASAKQRRGRAGRVRPGVSYHMFSSHTHQQDMEEYQLPEMLRVGLEDLVLQVLLLDLGEPSTFLSKAVNPPSALAMRNSLKLLEGLGAVECEWGDDGAHKKTLAPTLVSANQATPSCETMEVTSGLTALGFHLATLPVDPRVGKMMIYGALFGCIDPALTIAASMSARNPFMSPFDKRDEADAARKEFATEGSDHLTTLTAFKQWKDIRRSKGNGAAQSFLRESFLSRQTLFQMEDLRKQFADLLVDIGFLPRNSRLTYSRGRNGPRNKQSLALNVANANEGNVHLVKAILCAGLYPNIIVAPRPLVQSGAGLKSDKEAGECAFQSLKGDVHLHPATIAFSAKRLDSRYCCYHEIVKTSKTYVRDCTPVSEFALLLFGGSLQVYHTHGVVTVDEWLKFRIAAKPATLVKHLRAQMECMLLKKIVSPEEDVTGSREGRAMIEAVSTLLEREVKALPDLSGADVVRPYNMQNDGGNRPQNGRSKHGRGGSRSGGRGGRGRGGG